MFNAAHVAEVIHEAKEFGFTVKDVSFNWNKLQNARDTYIRRLNKIYENNLDGQKITRINGFASFDGQNTVRVGSDTFKAKHIVIAVGGAPNPLGVEGEQHVIDSDGFFALTQQPKKVAVIGAGYIAVELAGVLNSLGSDTSLFVRQHCALRNFDTMISSYLDVCMKKAGVKIEANSTVKSVVKENDGSLTLNLNNGKSYHGFDTIISAIGRHPLTKPLNLDSAGVKLTSNGFIAVDEFSNTTSQGVYALGDVIDEAQLTPVAIAAGRRLSDRLFGGLPKAKADYSLIPTVVFSHPTIGTIGLTEEEAIKQYGKEHIKAYNSTFVNLWYGSFYDGGVGDKPFTKYKLVTLLPDEKVIGLHSIGLASDEVIQGFAVAMKMGATKADFDNAIAIHPTAGEEFVTLPPWGLSPSHVKDLK